MSAPAWQRQLESKDGRWQQHEHSRHPKQLAGGRGQYGAGQTKGQSSLSNKSVLIQQQQLANRAGISASGSHVQQNVWRAQAQPQPYLASAGLPGSMGDGLPWSGGPAHSSNMSADQGDPRYKPLHAQPTWPVQSIADKALPGHIIPAEAPNSGQHTTAWHAAPYGESYSGRAPEQGAEGQRWYQR